MEIRKKKAWYYKPPVNRLRSEKTQNSNKVYMMESSRISSVALGSNDEFRTEVPRVPKDFESINVSNGTPPD